MAAGPTIIALSNGVVLPASDGYCSLVEALTNANADALIYPDCPASGSPFGNGGPFVLNAPVNSYFRVSTIDNIEPDGANGLPVITRDINQWC